MVAQLDWLAASSRVRVARALGEIRANQAEDKASAEMDAFREKARAFVLAYLKRHGPTPGESLCDEMYDSGIEPADKRAFGATFAYLSRHNLIRCLRSDLPRASGHGTSGGKLWALA